MGLFMKHANPTLNTDMRNYCSILNVWLPNWRAIIHRKREGLDYSETFSKWTQSKEDRLDYRNQKEDRLECQENDVGVTPVNRTDCRNSQRIEITELFAGNCEHIV